MIHRKLISPNLSGFTLIEVLVTVVILSIGLLGMAGIQIQGLRGTTSSTVRSQATILANDIAERIRMNNGGVFDINAGVNEQYSNVNIVIDENKNSSRPCEANTVTFCSVTSATPTPDTIPACDTQQMATFDIFEFACGLGGDGGLRGLMPAGTSATISCNNVLNGCPPGSQLTINISWPETTQADGTAQIKTISMVIIP